MRATVALQMLPLALPSPLSVPKPAFAVAGLAAQAQHLLRVQNRRHLPLRTTYQSPSLTVDMQGASRWVKLA
jgi:hypothetical protein